jgi:phage-related protein
VLFLGVLNFGEVLASIRGLANGIANSIGFIIQILTGLVEFWTGLATTITGIVKLIVDIVTGHWDRLGKDIAQIWQGVQLMLKGTGDTILGVVGGILAFIIGLVSGFINGVIDFFKFLYDKLIGHSIVVDLANGLRDWFQKAWDWITGIFKGIGQWFGDRFNDIKNFFADLPENLRNTAQDAWNKITGVFNGLSDWVRDNVWQPMADGLSNAFSGVRDTVTGIFNNIGGAIKWGINLVIDDVNGIIDNINSVSSKVGVSLPHIPKLAKGTDFFEGGMALVGEVGPELVMLPRGAQVIPNNQLGSYLPSGAQVTPQSAQQVVHVHVTVQPNDLVVDGQRLTNKMMPHVVNAIRDRTGHRSF